MGNTGRNKILTIIYSTLRTVALLCVTGPIMQTFLASLGFPSEWIYINNALIQAANMLTLSLCSQWTDKHSIIKCSILSQIPHAVLYLLYIPLCMMRSATFSAFATLTMISLLQTVCISLYTICEYKLPYYLYTSEDYGVLLSAIGIISSVISLGTGVLISWLTTFLSYADLMLAACAVSAVLIGLSVVCHMLCKPIIPQEMPERGSKKTINVLELFKQPVFYKMIPANTLRGFAYGITAIMATVALDLGYDASVSTALLSVQSFAMLVSYVIFTFSITRITPRLLVAAGCAPFLLMPLLLIKSPTLYLSIFAAIMIGRTIVDNAVPSMLRFAVPVEMAGPYNAWRMLLHYAGTLTASLVAAIVSPQVLLFLAMITQVFTGLSYFTTKEIGGRPLFKK